jgi:hypothetical protein
MGIPDSLTDSQPGFRFDTAADERLGQLQAAMDRPLESILNAQAASNEVRVRQGDVLRMEPRCG